MYRPEQVDMHHMCDAARIVAICLVHPSFQKCFGMLCFDTSRRKVYLTGVLRRRQSITVKPFQALVSRHTE